MSKSISILDKDYLQWVQELCKRYRQSQIKAALHVNKEVLNFYWELGRDIVCREEENRYGSKFYATLSKDLRHLLPDADGLSERNLRYTKKFYLLYNEAVENLQQVAASSDEDNLQQVAAQFKPDIFRVPWGHHMVIVDKFSGDVNKALILRPPSAGKRMEQSHAPELHLNRLVRAPRKGIDQLPNHFARCR